MTTNLAPLSGNLPATPAGFGGLGGNALGASGGPRTNPITRYLSAIRRFKWLVLLLTLVGVGGGVLMSRLKLPSFVVSGTILIADNSNGQLPVNAMYTSDQWREFFLSYAVMQPVAIQRQLFIKGPKRIGAPPLPLGPSGPDRAIFNGLTIDEDKLVAGTYSLKISEDGTRWELQNSLTRAKDAGVVGDSAGRAFGFRWVPRLERVWFGRTFDFEVITPREAADDLKGRTKVDMAFRAARFMNITLTGPEGPQSAATLNDLMSNFVDQAGVMKRRDLTTQARILDSQLTAADIRLRQSERDLEQFKVNTVTLPKDVLPVTPGLQQTTPQAYTAYQDRKNRLADLKRDYRDLTDALTKAENGELAVDLYSAIPSVDRAPDLKGVIDELRKSEADLRAWRIKYHDNYVGADVDMPKLISRIAEMRATTIPAYTRAVLRRLDSEIATLDSDIKSGGKELQDIPQRTITENRLQRDVDMNAGTYKALNERAQTARLLEASALPDVSILSKAVAPLNPTKNRREVIIAMGVILGLGAGLGLALLFDVTDKRVRYADQVTGGLGLTILGVIPEIKRAKGETPSAEEAAQVIEAFRTVRLNLAHTVGEGPIVLTISSPSPGDGKSLVSSNLALSFAEAGYKTILIDGDTRRGELHRTFGVDRRPGLLDYLAGELPLSELVRTSSHNQLALVTAGSRKRNAPELLGSAAMRELLATMKSRYEVVIVDSPPLGAGIDPFVLGTLTTNLILVLRAGATERDLAEAKLQIVDQLPIRLIGAVLNDVRASMNEYKYYSYSYGYSAVDEGDETKLLGGSSD